MTVDDLTCVNVASDALVEFIERIAIAGSADIQVSQGDRGWYVTYKPPFTRDIKKEVEGPDKEYPTPYSTRACQSCAGIKACAAKGTSWTYCHGRLYTQKSCSPQMIAEADCNGDTDKCGGVCHG